MAELNGGLDRLGPGHGGSGADGPRPKDLAPGEKEPLHDSRYTVSAPGRDGSGSADLLVVQLTAEGKVRTDDDLLFFNNPEAPGVTVGADQASFDLAAVPSDIDRLVLASSTETQGKTYNEAGPRLVSIKGATEQFVFAPSDENNVSVMILTEMYRKDGGWRLAAGGQGYAEGLRPFIEQYGIAVEDDPAAGQETASPAPDTAATAPETPKVSTEKSVININKDSPNKKVALDMRKRLEDPNFAVTVALEWDGRGAQYDHNGDVTRYGEGDLDVYFCVRNEDDNTYQVLSGEPGHQGGLAQWPYILHGGDSLGPGQGNKPAAEAVQFRPVENGQVLVNVYQSVDNGSGAIDTFGKPRVVVRYGDKGEDGLPAENADELHIEMGTGEDNYWATIAMIDVIDGILQVDGTTRYSDQGSESMPVINSRGEWTRNGGPTGRSKRQNGTGLNRYAGTCPG